MRVVSTVTFMEDGSVVIVYLDPSSDVRNRGLLVQSHQLHIGRGDDAKDYGEEIDDLNDAIKRLLDDALDDFVNTPAQVGDELDEPDDDNER